MPHEHFRTLSENSEDSRLRSEDVLIIQDVSVYRYFDFNRAQKAKYRVTFLEFPSVNFHKIGKIGNKWFSSELVFQGNLAAHSFRSDKTQKLAKIERTALKTLLFSCLKFVFRGIRFTVKILGDFTEENSRKSQKSHKLKRTCLGIYNSRL